MDDHRLSRSTPGPAPKGNQPAVIASEAACTSVDAGAGTGKTTTMLARIERALEDGAVDPSDVLVVTFANEAAASIRASITERLEPSVAAAIEVHTYHSFCYRLVREYAYYLGLSPSFEVVTERKRRRLLNRLLAEYEYDFAAVDVAPTKSATPSTLAGSVDHFVSVMSREEIAPDALIDALPDERTLDLLEELLLWLRGEATESLSFDNEAIRYFNRDEHVREIREALVEYGTLLTFCREKIAEGPAAFRDDPVVREVDAYLRTLQACVTRTREAMSLDDPSTKHLPPVLFGNELWRDGAKTVEQTPFGRLEHYVAVLRQAGHYAEIYADYRARLETDGAVDFDELVRTATRLLEDEAVAEEITRRWSHVYCDEFQDTDATQWTLVTELTRGPDRPDLLAIGDTDQAIYGWRGTDPRGLERLGANDGDHESVELELNFRSKQEILDLTNHCSYGTQPSKTLREYERTRGAYDEANPPHRVLKVESDELESSTPEQVGTAISRLLNGDCGSVPERTLEDIAVIVRTNAQARNIAAELEQRQIPCERSGSATGSVSEGTQTVLSYLRVLVDHDADTHLRRVLLTRYRVCEADLSRLHRRNRRLYDALFEADLEAEPFDEPDRLERARADLEALAAAKDASPIAPFLRQFRERTCIEWFLGPDDRQTFERIERFVDARTGTDVLESLSTRFVDALERVLAGGSRDRQQGTTSADAVDVMTVHQAKGLEFDTVLAPYLSDEEWCVRRDYAYGARYRLLAARLDPAVDSPLCADLAAEPTAESWRVLHVALTRAENHLLVFGSNYDYEGGDGDLAASMADACLPSAIEWSVTGERMNLWSELVTAFDRVQETYPETVVNVTDSLAEPSTHATGTIDYLDTDGHRTLETDEALDVVHRLGRQLRNRTLLPAADAAPTVPELDAPAGRRVGALDTAASRFAPDAFSESGRERFPEALEHSYSALATHDECPRKHYLEYVVGAPDDPVSGDDGRQWVDSTPGNGRTSRESNPRLVGTVFHAVAEEAFYREYSSPGEWRRAATRRLTARGQRGYEKAVHRCIDRYFDAREPDLEAPVHAWDELAAELSFAADDVPGVDGSVVGYVDTVRRAPDGRLVVLDYKATSERIDPEAALQLSLYARACERRLGEPVDAVGYVYVGPVEGPRVALHSPSATPDWGAVRRGLEALDRPTYAETTPGSHCRSCPHRSLGCGPPLDVT
ncbi:UvrD-helicase domain-containing protein [Saliphagus sp. GCM10025317]